MTTGKARDPSVRPPREMSSSPLFSEMIIEYKQIPPRVKEPLHFSLCGKMDTFKQPCCIILYAGGHIKSARLTVVRPMSCVQEYFEVIHPNNVGHLTIPSANIKWVV